MTTRLKPCPRCVTGTVDRTGSWTLAINRSRGVGVLRICAACDREQEFRRSFGERPWPRYPDPQFVRRIGGRHQR